MQADEFLYLTPRILNELLKRSRQMLRITDLQHGILTAAVANTAPWPPKTPATPQQFMVLPPIDGAKPPEEKPVDVGEKLMAIFGMPLGST